MEISVNKDLFMVVIGGKPEGRFTEQHDVFFGIGDGLKDLVPSMYEFWPALGVMRRTDKAERAKRHLYQLD